MSYILDALKRADAERERGAVPGLHAQPAAMALPDELARQPLPPWAWGLGGLAVALAGMLAWSLWRSDETPPSPQVAQAAPGGQEAWPASTHQGTPGQGPGASRPWPPQDGMRPPREGSNEQRPHRANLHEPRGSLGGMPSNNASTSDRPEPARSARRADTEAGVPAKASQAASPASATAVATQPDSPSTAASAAANTRVYALHELPDQVRRSLPQLVIGGAMYSDNPGSRMLVINSQLFHEGDKLGPDLTLEEIKLKSAVLRYRTWRYGVTY